MAILTGQTATQPAYTTAVVEQGVIIVNLAPAGWRTIVVACEGATPVVTTAPPQPNSVSITPAVAAITTQNGTLTLGATVKDQYGNLYTSGTLVWSSNDPHVTINSSTGVATGFQTGGNATITVQVAGTNVTGTSTITTPAATATTLTMNAGYANLAAAANAGGYTIGFSVNDSYESNLNYAQNYQQMSGAGSISTSEKFETHWISAVNSTSSVTTNFQEFTQEFARLQAQGTKLKLYLINGAAANQWPGLTTYVTSAGTANTMLATIATAVTGFFATAGSPAAYNAGTAYSYGQTVTSGGFKWTCIVPTGTVTGVTPALGALNAGGQYVWLKTSSGAIHSYNIVNECYGFGSANANAFTAQILPTTWVPTFARAIFAGDPGAKIELNNNHYAYDGTGQGSTAQNTATLALMAAVLAGGSVGGAGNLVFSIEGHWICSVMQNTTSTSATGFNAANFTAFLNSLTTLGYGYAISEMDGTDDMFEGAGAAGIPERQAAIGIGYANYLAAIKAATAKPDHLIVWQLRSPESWINENPISPRSDGLTQYPDLLSDFNFTESPAWSAFVTFLVGSASVIGTITINDSLLHFVPAVLADQWSFPMSLSLLNWTSTNTTNIPVNVAGQFQCLAGSQTATITGTLATNGAITGTIAVTSGTPALTALAITPPSATLASGTLQLVATEVDQFGVAWAGGGGLGGVATFTSSGFGLAANNTTVAAAANQLWYKERIKVDFLHSIGAWNGFGLWGIDADGAGTDPKLYFGGAQNGSSQVALTLVGYQSNTSHSGPITPYVLISALPAVGNYVTIYAGWDQTNFKYYIAVCDENGNIITDTNGNTLAVTQSANYGALNTTGGANGRIQINKLGIGGYASVATTRDGAAFYVGTPPTISYSLTATCFAKPTSGDTGIQMAWLMGDVTSGAYASATALVGTALTLTNATGGLGDAAGWTATAAAATAWTSSVPAAATVNSSTGLVTFVAPGATNVQATLASNSTVNGTAVITCQTVPTLTSLTVSPTVVTLTGSGSTAQVTPTLLDQYSNPFTGATLGYGSSVPADATVSGTGLVTWAAVGSTVVTTTATTTSPPVTLTATTAVTTAAGAPSNMPSGYTAIINTGVMTAVPVSGTVVGGTTYSMFSASTVSSTGDWSGNLTAVPSAQGTGLRITFPPNVVKGNSSVRFGWGFGGAGPNNLYVRLRVRYSSNWTSNGNPTVKLWQSNFANNSNGGSENNFFAGSAGGGSFPLSMVMYYGQQSSTLAPRNLGGYGTDTGGDMAGASAGSWHTIEILLTAQSSVTATTATSDGGISLWMDNALAFTANNVYWVTPSDYATYGAACQNYNYMQFINVYGGTTASPPNVSPNICVDIDQLFVAGH